MLRYPTPSEYQGTRGPGSLTLLHQGGFCEGSRSIMEHVDSMTTNFPIQSSDSALLEKAVAIATDFARGYATPEMVGIVFLGAIARGYYDPSSDIDIALFKKRSASVPLEGQYLHIDDFEVHYHLSDYEAELDAPWDMPKRWTFSQGRIFHDPDGLTAQLLAKKVPLKLEERRWLLMSGLSLSEWYSNRLSKLWVERGNLISAHQMFGQGLEYFLQMLFALNNELVADTKWQYYCAERLQQLPTNFPERVQETMRLRVFSPEEIDLRRGAFMEMWREILPVVEAELQMPYEEINKLV